jgi:hypothetical protein
MVTLTYHTGAVQITLSREQKTIINIFLFTGKWSYAGVAA